MPASGAEAAAGTEQAAPKSSAELEGQTSPASTQDKADRRPARFWLIVAVACVAAAAGIGVAVWRLAFTGGDSPPGAVVVSPSPAATEVTTPASPTPSATTLTPGMELTERCTNPDGFTVSYPGGWVTNEDAVRQLPPCSLFDPESVDAGGGFEVPLDIAVFVRTEQVPFEELEEDSVLAEQLSREELIIDGREAVRVESRATEEGFLPGGTLTTSYRIDMDGRTLFASSHDIGELDYTTKQQVLDAMMETLQFTE